MKNEGFIFRCVSRSLKNTGFASRPRTFRCKPSFAIYMLAGAPKTGDPMKFETLWSPLGRNKETADPLEG